MQGVRWAKPRNPRVRFVCGAIALLASTQPLLAQTAPGGTLEQRAPGGTLEPTAPGGTLDRIKQAGRIRVGYRTDARPLSYRDESGKPAGYSVALCEQIVAATKAELGLADLAIDWVPVTVENRFQVLQQGAIDLLCGAESATLARRREVAFSIPIFPGGIGALLRTDAAAKLKEVMAGKTSQSRPLWRATAGQFLQEQTFSVVAGTTAEAWLAGKLDEFKLTAKVAPVQGYEAGVQQLVDRKASVFFGDRAILLDASKRSTAAADLALLDRLFTYEPLALALARGDENFRLVVDRTLSHLYRSGEIGTLYATYWGTPGDEVLAFFRWNALPD